MAGSATPQDLDLSALPGVASYLARLPEGLNSYPQCLMRTDFARNAQADFPDTFDHPGCPPALRNLLDLKRNTAAWHPVTHAFASLRLVRDLGCGGSQALWSQKSELGVRKIFSQPLFRALFLVISPHLVFLGFQKRWQDLCQGVTLVPTEKARDGIELGFTFPPRLLDGFALNMLALGLKVAVEMTRRTNVTSRVTRMAETEARFKISWQ